MSAHFHGHPAVATTAEVWAVLRARHGKDMSVFSSYSDPDGMSFGGSGEKGCMETTFGLKDSDFPLIGARTTWRIEGEHLKRYDEQTEYWLLAAKKEAE